ncbi:MAG: monovalent cation/H(+) antiporter subunit G [Deltaproteobacteria bacterium]|jgi:monovalent cation/proton antiporter MnhG/PhaG subunit|nr:monovalent cation/H(+) antiporter subunit G [Deltaproteobacteria bacterium]MBW2534952.1 monovalent cation/H(+) antiporter subunit G [Deltaproteobacteria bacterium]
MTESILTALALVASVAGAFFFFASAVGLARLPDLYARLHAPTKAATLGLLLLVVGSALATGSGDWSTLGEDLLLVLFVLLTIPVSSQMLARAAICRGAAHHPRTRGEPPPCPIDPSDEG